MSCAPVWRSRFQNWTRPGSIRELTRIFTLGYAQVLVELLKSARLGPEDLRRHVDFRSLEPLRQCWPAGVR